MVEVPVLLERVAEATGELKERIMAKGVVEYLKSELRRVNSEAIEIRSRYGVDSAREMDERYEKGELDEENSWRDFFRLSHLEERREVLEGLLEEASVEWERGLQADLQDGREGLRGHR